MCGATAAHSPVACSMQQLLQCWHAMWACQHDLSRNLQLYYFLCSLILFEMLELYSIDQWQQWIVVGPWYSSCYQCLLLLWHGGACRHWCISRNDRPTCQWLTSTTPRYHTVHDSLAKHSIWCKAMECSYASSCNVTEPSMHVTCRPCSIARLVLPWSSQKHIPLKIIPPINRNHKNCCTAERYVLWRWKPRLYQMLAWRTES